ncbi:uncharacterized protein LOC122814291 [Protopterus annectens]|uniref:uncharacterized protein LOC122814291 n=1 Tax=Protopterus annectens TaxID=7888 RepID=UPI001CFA616C|nr:uncharacterized protein LOC122814291 [Protopterus annectens]
MYSMSRMKDTTNLGFLMTYLAAMFLPVCSWHDLDNTDYDCWPIDQPNEYNMIDCGGLQMAWVVRPPEKVTSGQEFNVTFSVQVSDSFYERAVRDNILRFSNASEAKKFCEEKDCPLSWKDANEENCCIHHANIHSCPLSFMKKGGICGPWIPDDGKIVTHTISQAGKMTQQNWTCKVVLFLTGITSMIAHIKVGHMHAALEAKTSVSSTKVCGDEICEPDEGCALCPADCGPCPMSMSIKIAIGIPIAFFCSAFLLTLVWFQYQKQKMLWDESWIINLKDLIKGSAFESDFGSSLSLQKANNTKGSSGADITVSNCTLKHSVIQAGI